MKIRFLSIVASTLLIGCGGGSSSDDSSNEESLPMSSLSISIENSFELTPIQTPSFSDKYDKGNYELCWIDSTDVEACSEPIILAEYLESPTPFNMNVYGDASIYFRPINNVSNYTDAIKVRDEALFEHSSQKLDITMTPKNKDFAGFVIIPNSNAPIENVFLDYITETGEYKHGMDKDENGYFYAYKNISNSQDSAKITVKFKHGDTISTTVSEPKIGVSYKFEIKENHASDLGVSIEPDFGNLENENSCIGNGCFEPDSVIPFFANYFSEPTDKLEAFCNHEFVTCDTYFNGIAHLPSVTTTNYDGFSIFNFGSHILTSSVNYPNHAGFTANMNSLELSHNGLPIRDFYDKSYQTSESGLSIFFKTKLSQTIIESMFNYDGGETSMWLDFEATKDSNTEILNGSTFTFSDYDNTLYFLNLLRKDLAK